MKYALSQELKLEKAAASERQIRFHPSPADHTHFQVYCIWVGGKEEVIGHVYLDSSGYEYVATDAHGRELFPPTTDFNEIAMQFDLHARLLATENVLQEINTEKSQSNYLSTLNLNQMKNSNNTIAKGKKENQLIFVEYEKPTKEGHLITVVDSYHNTIGRIHRSYNEQTKKYEFTAYDHANKPLYMRSEKVWELKSQFTANRGDLLEQAHQRRIESKEQSRNAKEQPQIPEKKADDRKVETGKTRQDKSSNEKNKSFDPHEREDKNQITIEDVVEREDELDSIRDHENGREDSLER